MSLFSQVIIELTIQTKPIKGEITNLKPNVKSCVDIVNFTVLASKSITKAGFCQPFLRQKCTKCYFWHADAMKGSSPSWLSLNFLNTYIDVYASPLSYIMVTAPLYSYPSRENFYPISPPWRTKEKTNRWVGCWAKRRRNKRRSNRRRRNTMKKQTVQIYRTTKV